MTWETERAARDAEPRCQVCDGPNVDGSGCEHCPAVDPRPHTYLVHSEFVDGVHDDVYTSHTHAKAQWNAAIDLGAIAAELFAPNGDSLYAYSKDGDSA